MSVTFSAFLFFVWIGIAAVSAIYDASTISNSALATVTSFEVWREQQISLLFFSFSFPAPNLAFFGAIGSLLLWDSQLWGGWGQWIRVPLFLSLTFGVVTSLILTLFGNRLSKG